MITDEDIIQVLKSMHACCSKREVSAVRAVLAYVSVKQHELTAAHAACPCLHITPCDPQCTCVNKYSSRGCERCCSYGSKEQQRFAASRLASQPAEILDLLRQRAEKWMEAMKPVDAQIAADAVAQAALTREKQLIGDAKITAEEYRKLWHETSDLRDELARTKQYLYEAQNPMLPNGETTTIGEIYTKWQLAEKNVHTCTEVLANHTCPLGNSKSGNVRWCSAHGAYHTDDIDAALARVAEART